MMLRLLKFLLVLGLLVFGGLLLRGDGRRHPENVPWEKLDLAQPVGAFTGEKLARLHGRAGECRALLTDAGVGFTALPALHAGRDCGYGDAVRLSRGSARAIAFQPAGVGVSCAVAAGLTMWERNVVQPAAARRFGTKVTGIEHFGSYNCRRVYGRADEPWSEHSRANAIDVAGFRLADGERVSVATDWSSKNARGAFLHDVRDGACRLFTHTLSPDYNAAHHDHLHLDEAEKGGWGWRTCRLSRVSKRPVHRFAASSPCRGGNKRPGDSSEPPGPSRRAGMPALSCA